MMTCDELAKRLAELQPELASVDVARLALMILTQCDDTTSLEDDDALISAWKNATSPIDCG